MNKNRKREMANARREAKNIRLCQSIISPEKKCKYGENCKSEHSIEAYLKAKPDDIGDKCVNFDMLGKCPYGLACRYSSAHTNEDRSQITKEPNPSYMPTLNSETMKVQIDIRKNRYDFTKTVEVSKK
jgi:tRNA-dihydrouridine synthase 3